MDFLWKKKELNTKRVTYYSCGSTDAVTPLKQRRSFGQRSHNDWQIGQRFVGTKNCTVRWKFSTCGSPHNVYLSSDAQEDFVPACDAFTHPAQIGNACGGMLKSSETPRVHSRTKKANITIRGSLEVPFSVAIYTDSLRLGYSMWRKVHALWAEWINYRQLQPFLIWSQHTTTINSAEAATDPVSRRFSSLLWQAMELVLTL